MGREVSSAAWYPEWVADDPQAKTVGDNLRALIARAAGEFTLEVTANLIELCPVKTGHARANFVPAVGAGFSGVASDGSAQAAGIVAVTSYQLGDGPLSISNNVPYIDRLIAGYSAQQPAGWDLVAIDRGAQAIQARYDTLQIDVTSGVPGLSSTGVTFSVRDTGEG